MGEEEIHIRPVRSKDLALLKNLGFSSPHILFKSAAREAKPARGNSHGEGTLLENLSPGGGIASMSSEEKTVSTNTRVDLKTFLTLLRCEQCV